MAATAEASGITIANLPDALLGRIFALAADRSCRDGLPYRSLSLAGIPLVSHRWLRVCLSEPALWRLFKAPRHGGTGAEALQVQLVLLQRVAPQVAAFEWWPTWDCAVQHESLPAFLAALQPSRLLQLKLCSVELALPGSVVASMQQFTCLTQLSLEWCGKAATLQAQALLPGVWVSTLRSLMLECSDEWVSSQLLGRILQLSQLTELHLQQKMLSASFSWPPLGPLTRLSQLRVLALHDPRLSWEYSPSTLQLPEPAAFPGLLESYDIAAFNVAFELAGARLNQCCFDACDPSIWSRPDMNALRLAGIASMPSLSRLLGAALPPGQQLERLALLNSSLEAAALVGCTQLCHLRALCICKTFSIQGADEPPRMASGTVAQALEALLEQTPQLRCLELAAGWGAHRELFQLCAVPDCLVRCRHLTRQVLEAQGLSELPAGPYLTGLRELSLAKNSFTHLPPALSTATALDQLDCTGLDASCLSSDALGVLCSLPHLQRLCLGSIPAEWQHRLPHVHAGGGIQCVYESGVLGGY